ncbi:hypothetical protein HAX54_038589 [Datura stramonium]|uniref:Uncharacterized protein n=1 Tax=Datura stramonium TaxID=4076 RepID=A0ABS8SIB6_DATST|nr:hypothetical protein [Datura stramonium]
MCWIRGLRIVICGRIPNADAYQTSPYSLIGNALVSRAADHETQPRFKMWMPNSNVSISLTASAMEIWVVSHNMRSTDSRVQINVRDTVSLEIRDQARQAVTNLCHNVGVPKITRIDEYHIFDALLPEEEDFEDKRTEIDEEPFEEMHLTKGKDEEREVEDVSTTTSIPTVMTQSEEADQTQADQSA